MNDTIKKTLNDLTFNELKEIIIQQHLALTVARDNTARQTDSISVNIYSVTNEQVSKWRELIDIEEIN